MNNNFSNEEELSNVIPAETNGLIPAVTFGEDPDEKPYLVLLTVYVPEEDRSLNNEVIREWSIKIGRQATYDYLRDMVKYEAIDPNRSFIIACNKEVDDFLNKENVSLDQEPITVFRFLKAMREGRKVLDSDDMFNIDDFNDGNENGDITILEV